MPEVGEELVGAWLRSVPKCDFVQYNVPLRDKQGEIDVIGINLEQGVAYVCEVATHLGGLQYTKNRQPDNVNRITHKFEADVEYAQKYLDKFPQHRFMLWSPVVKYPLSREVKHNQFDDLIKIQRNLLESRGIEIEMIVNEIYLERVMELRKQALEETAASEYSVFRLFQILEKLDAHVAKLEKRGVNSQAVLGGL